MNPKRLFPASLLEWLAWLIPLTVSAGVAAHVAGLQVGPEERFLGRAREGILLIQNVLAARDLDGLGFPATLEVLVEEAYLPDVPADPWGRPYRYRNPGRHRGVDIYSLGPDGVESEDDVKSWDLWPVPGRR